MNSTAPSSKPKATPAMDNDALAKKYGRAPGNALIARNRLKERKYFDSGDYAMNKAGKGGMESVGKEHPSPDAIPHHVPNEVPAGTAPAVPGKALNPLLQKTKPAVTIPASVPGQSPMAGPISPMGARRPFRSSLSKEAETLASDSEDQKD
ncbi:hypothetical protein LPJ77_006272 [Coemansia sp. RSA 2523]|nr:hypothetical protein LPJ77_006272 [Coemansia sp. RSA 2523]KAJ2168126.1 hypothetical protein GGH15_001627 [Coemansia sp. RSA 562]KAJ2181704.1 hypothetical protein GGF45_001374 [Coemansia sp. RSA 551]KAJ2187864.1 hypothetical protein EV181_002525 [Coemansia sp. RSA 532]KAJ2193380.1 hypothetical protein GGH18_002566 [Coemansia sp. RSA 530]KAJ2208227.1 hypothetical protein IW145_000901 [Coemansia sp. RSA 521]KAJ2229210.1 hypothetical protein GGH97_006317 [Coemansia sp. RSA 475]KAJ2230629.1 hy